MTLYILKYETVVFFLFQLQSFLLKIISINNIFAIAVSERVRNGGL